MTLVKWDDTSKVDVQEIDSQHEALIGLLNQLHQAMKLRHDREALGALLSELLEDTRKHFSYEESLMSDHEYPEYARHKAEHEKLLQHAVDLERRFRSGDLLLSFAVVLDLQNWATNHISHSDKRLGAFLNAKNVF